MSKAQITLKISAHARLRCSKSTNLYMPSRVMTRALRLREHSGGIKPQNRAQLKPAKHSCTILTLDEVRSDVLGVTDGSAVIGHEANKNTC